MTGVAFELDVRQLGIAAAKINAITDVHKSQLLDELGGVIVSQTQERLATEKTTPDGDAWPEWSPVTASMRHSGQSLLFASGALVSDIHHIVSSDEVAVGSGLVYAAIQHEGGMAGRENKVEIPAREYLGISNDNRDELEEVVEDFFKRVLP